MRLYSITSKSYEKVDNGGNYVPFAGRLLGVVTLGVRQFQPTLTEGFPRHYNGVWIPEFSRDVFKPTSTYPVKNWVELAPLEQLALEAE